MNLPITCIAVIPCLNEEASIYALVQAVRAYVPDVIVVDDGSTDSTALLAQKAGAQVLRHSTPRGKGAALNTGWREALSRGFDWALAMDGDGQHAPEDIPAFLNAASDGEADLIIGNRFANPGRMPWLRRNVNRWMSKRLSRAAGFPLPDSQCGFRMMRLASWSRLELEADHFEIESEMLLKFIARGYGLEFIPVRTIYAGERSKIHPIRDTLRWFRWYRSAARIMVQGRTSRAIPLPVGNRKQSVKV